MTINSATRKAGPFLGDGATTVFPFTFKVFTKNDVQVTRTDANGAETRLVLDSDYSVTVNPDQTVSPGGSITYPISGSPLALSYKLTLTGALQNLQPTSLPNNGPFYPQTVEDAFDRSVILDQQLQEQIDRAIKISISDTPLTPLPTAAGRANSLMGFDAAGNLVVYQITSSVGAGDIVVDMFVNGVDYTAGATTQLSLSRPPGSPGNLEVFFDALFQGPDQWTVNANTLTLNSAIPLGVGKVFARIGTTLSNNIPPDGSVTGEKLASGAVVAHLGYTPLNKAGDTMNGPLNQAQGTNIASASTVNLTASTGNYVHITGTSQINAITLAQGAEREVVFDSTLILANSANLILPGGQDIGTMAGDVARFRGEAGGVVRCVGYFLAQVPPSLAADGAVNKILNGGFDVWQLGTHFVLGPHLQKLADRWNYDYNGAVGSATVDKYVFSTGNLPIVGKFYPRNGLRITQLSAGTGNTFQDLSTQIEGVHTLSGKKATISFYGICLSGNNQVIVKTEQYFGSGGSPSSPVFNTAAPMAISNLWKRYSVTFDIQDINSKTLGSNGDDTLNIILSLPVNALFDFIFTGVMINEGAYALPFPVRNFADILNACQHYLVSSYSDGVAPGTVTTEGAVGFSQSGPSSVFTIQLPTKMARLPAVTLYNPATGAQGSWNNSGSPVSASVNTNGTKNVTVSLSGGSDQNFCTGHYVIQDPYL